MLKSNTNTNIEPRKLTVTVILGITVLILTVGLGTQAVAAEEWNEEETSVDVKLHEVVHTSEGIYAVGENGVVVKRTEDGWETVIEDGPSGNGNDLYGADVTDDGDSLWFVGANGAIGKYDVSSGSLNDLSAPMDVTNNFNDVAVSRDGSNVYVAGDSGKIYYSFDDGETGTWNSSTPGSGSAITGIDFYNWRSGHAVDSNGNVFATTDGKTWDKIGISGADRLYSIDSDTSHDVWVSGESGMVFEYDGSDWESTDLGSFDLHDIENENGGYVVGDNGTVYRLDSGEWEEETTDTTENLAGVSIGEPDVAVGADGTAITNADTNTPPTANFTYTPNEPEVGEEVTFNASASNDTDGTIESYDWDTDDDGEYEKSGETITHTFESSVDETVTLRVTDNDGAINTTLETITVTEESSDTDTDGGGSTDGSTGDSTTNPNNARPIAGFEVSPEDPSAGESVTFTSDSFDP
ncbi:MAG: PKD domain-containing protein, partial [Halobacteria archaeon]|nr:PKD domain-containing protein [Halobacteria archaeon]